MTVSVHCFGKVAEAVGTSSIEIPLPDPCTVGVLAEQLTALYPGLADTTFKIAVDRRMADNAGPVPVRRAPFRPRTPNCSRSREQSFSTVTAGRGAGIYLSGTAAAGGAACAVLPGGALPG